MKIENEIPFKIKLAPMGNTGKEIILMDCAQELELGEIYACTSMAEKRLLLNAVNNHSDLLAALKDALDLGLLDISRMPQSEAKRLISLRERLEAAIARAEEL